MEVVFTPARVVANQD